MITVRAHAKINLNLRILGRRPDDGYHDLRTVFQALSLHDTLTFAPARGPFALECSDPALPTDRTNLVSRAADALWKHLGRDGNARDARVHIEKRIPMKGGLGGGSSDAAAALVGLAHLWAADVPVSDLRALGRGLGADVGFFFTGGAALGEGRGDQLSPLPDLPPLGVLLVVPEFDVSTADAYRWADEARDAALVPDSRSLVPDSRFPVPRIPRCHWPEPLCEIANDFEPVIAARHPELDRVKAAIRAEGADAVAMTGSGSTVFGLFADPARLDAAAAKLGRDRRVFATRTLGRAEYREQAAARPPLVGRPARRVN